MRYMLIVMAILSVLAAPALAASVITPSGQNDQDMYAWMTRINSMVLGNRVLSGCTPSFVAGSTTIDLAAGTVMIANRPYTIAAVTPQAISGGTQAVSLYNVILFSTDAAGTITQVDGTAAATLAKVTMPVVASGKCPIALVVVLTDSTHQFVPGTTALNGAGITTKVYPLVGGYWNELSSMSVAQ